MREILLTTVFVVLVTGMSAETTTIRCSFIFLGNLTPPVPYKCVTLGVDVQREGTKVTGIGGYHHYRKNNLHVKKVEFTSSWSTHLPDGFGEYFPSLTEFEVRDAPLKTLRRSNFAAMSKLVILAIENTKLSSLPEDVFAEIPHLEELAIIKSQLRTLSPMTFAPLLQLRFFDGKYNRITRLDRDLFSNNTHLESINLNRNDISEIELNFSRFKNLIEVYLFKCHCINSYYLKGSSRFTLGSLNLLIKKRCPGK